VATNPPAADRRFHLAGERGLFWLGAFAIATALGLLQFAYRYLDDLTRDHPGTFGMRLLEEATGSYAGLLLLVGLVWLARRFPLGRASWRRSLPVHLAGFIACTVLLTLLRWGSRAALAPLVGLGPYDYGRFPTRFFMEAQNDVLWYAAALGALALLDAHRSRRARERREEELRRHLVEAQLRSLRLQLQPHFLFNALNTISQTMYQDPAAADEMIGHLAELLRHSLRTTQRQEVALEEELGSLRCYAAIMAARFGDDLVNTIDATPEALGARVPSLLLQPLVENAVRHGNAARTGRGHIAVAAWRDGERLALEVEDDGAAGDPPDRTRSDASGGGGGGGIGHAATAERLALLYGADHELRVGRAPGRGFVVAMRIPYRIAPPAADAPTPSGRVAAAVAGADACAR
jgi:signal transduction histidine kinase